MSLVLPTDDAPASAERDRARRGIVIPIGIIVAVAIVFVVIAVLGSARRADEVALATERSLLERALYTHGERMQRELDSAANSEAAYRKIRRDFDIDWVEVYIGQRLQSYFGHHFVFVTDASDQLMYATLGQRQAGTRWFNSVRNDLIPALERLRRDSVDIATLAGDNSAGGLSQRVTRLHTFLDRPAIIAAIAITGQGDDTENVPNAPIVMSVKLIDDEVLAEIASHLQLRNLRLVDDGPRASADHIHALVDPKGRTVAQFAWSPKRPGAEIVDSVTPFVAIAIAGLALLAGLVLRHMRRTAAAIAAGESRLRHLALHDPLCGLPNRIFFAERLASIIAEVRGGSPPAALLYVDLDHFKDVNDTLGHPIGDELIRVVTQRLTHALRDSDLVARIGGDEFAVITDGATEHSALLMMANRLIATLCAPYTVNGQTIMIGASIGIAIISDASYGSADVMRHADMALYRAKNEGRNRACLYDAAMDIDLLKRKSMEHDLRQAIERNELRVAYQPIVSSNGTSMVGVEALCRWTHPERGEITPSEFIPIAEDSGLIVALGEWILRRACIDGGAWPDLVVSVNVSPLQFRRPDFVDAVERILSETGFDPTRLELEVTESTLLGNVDTAELAMFRLKALGVRLALDDFGTGYSSLLYLRRFPFDKLKIDRSFVASIERAADAAAIVHAVISLGRGLGMKVTAEGVENAEQQLFLRAAGVHSMQGYRFGRPGPAADISRRLADPATFTVADEKLSFAMAC
ncbi:MAG: EAL domain-containing protein [Hyphomicrobiales bacterium]|nr:EAL domain-containing protein [Hyphomicrobiales bacterium]